MMKIWRSITTAPSTKWVRRAVKGKWRQACSGIGQRRTILHGEGIFPGDNIGLESDAEQLKIARDSLETMDSWNQGNAFANIFVMGARVGWPAEDLLNRMKARISSIKKPNLTYQSDGHGIEGAGAIEAINAMLLQSHEHVLRFFPVWPNVSLAVCVGEEKIEVIPDGKYFTFETEADTEYRIYPE